MSGRAIMAFGFPGSGKGTHVEKLCRVIEGRGQTCQVIEVGRCLRSIVAEANSSVVIESLAEVMQQGRLAPEAFPLYALMKEIVEVSISDVVFLDGFGRRLSELRVVLRLFKMLCYKMDAFLLDISEEEARKRLLSRGRMDDTPEVIEERIFSYRKDTEVSLRYLCRAGLLHKVSGMGSIEETHQQLLYHLSI